MHPRLSAALAALALSLALACAHAPSAPPPSAAPAPVAAAPAAPAARAAGPRALGVNGLGTNWGGPNGLDANGLGSNWGGPNGVHPGALGTGTIDSPEFAAWFAKDPAQGDRSMVYFVRCAYAAGTTIAWTDAAGKRWSWPGQFGLAQETFAADRRMSADEGRWVTACLMAHVNTKGTHQYISLRGNPPGAAARAALAPTDAERWTMSYPEGVFSGDSYAGAASGGWTFGLDLPPAYQDASPVWQPPSLVLGRTLDFGGWRPDGWAAPYVTVVGPFLPNRARFSLSPGGVAADPDYPYDRDCVGPQGAGCAPVYFPLFVHEARLANLEDPSPASPGRIVQVVDTGATPIDRAAQVKACAGADECVGQAPGSGPSPAPGAKLVGLRAGQAVEGVLRLTEKLRQAGIAPPAAGHPFTAIVRYSAAQPAAVRIRAGARDGSLRDLGVVQVQATGAADRYEWLQVYPVYASAAGGPDAPAALRIELAGVAAPAGGAAPPAPELDAVGFVPAWPWCSREGVDFAGNCPR